MKTNYYIRVACAVAIFAVLGLGGCNSGGTSNDTSRAGKSVASAPLDAADAAELIPTLADLRAHVQMTDAQTASIDAALMQWRTAVADRRERMHSGERPPDRAAGGMFPPAATFLSESGKTLQTDQFVALANYLKEVQTAHRSQIPEARHQFGGAMGDRMVRRLVDQLALSPDQEKQVRQVLQDLRAAREKAFTGGKDAPTPDSIAFVRAREELMSRLSSVLTPDQLAQFKSLQEKRHQKMEANKGDWKDAKITNGVERIQGILQLSDGQATQIRQILADLPAPQRPDGKRGHPMGGFRGPMMGGGQLLKAQSQIRAVLSPDQARRFDAVLQLLPGPQDRP
jgi:Spy/CpxP family protein refolding chaperone